LNVFRFLYINIYAFLLIGLACVLFIIPLDIFLLILKIIFILILLISGIGIFSQWRAKNKMRNILIAKNLNGLRIDTFVRFRDSLCMWLIADSALRELRKTAYYLNFTDKNWKKIRSAAKGKRSKKTGSKHLL